MELDAKWLKQSIKPYHNEACYCFIIDAIIIIASTMILYALDLEAIAPQLFYVFPIYFVVECFVNYRISLVSLLEVHFQKFETELLK